MADKHEVVILVVDDDEGHLELVRRNLQRAGLSNTVVPLTSGEAALDYVYCRGDYRDRATDGRLLMLLDINMPGIDGIEVLTTLKADPAKARMPVIMLTTTDDPRDVERCYKIGCSVYVTKPVSSDRFMDAVKRLGLFISVVELPGEEEGVAQ